MFRPVSLLVAGVLVLAACSGGDDQLVVESTTVPPAPQAEATPDNDQPAADSDSAQPGSAEQAAESASAPEISVRVAASGFDGPSVDTEVSWSDEPGDDTPGPFGRFGSCSGLRTSVGSYSVLVSGSDDLDAVNVWTADPVFGPGIHDAEVRIERAGAAPIVASGTMTLLDGLQQGEFLAFGPAGGRVEGTFSCTGTPAPTPLRSDADAANGVEAVEVFALLRDGGAERVLALAADELTGARCPLVEVRSDDSVVGSSGVDGPVTSIVDVAGDETLGGITSFELSGGGSPRASLRAGGTVYEFDDLQLLLDETGAAGAFSGATADGVAVDGAFRCA